MTINLLDQLIKNFSRLPGLGPRSARRAVLFLTKHREDLLLPLIEALDGLANSMRVCTRCANIDVIEPCSICTDTKRDPSVICVVEDVADLWALERAKVFSGCYHVLGGTLSALDGRGPEDLFISALITRARSSEISEIILGTSATVDGQTTAHYLADRLAETGVSVSRLAHGLPVGGELDYLDDGTLSAALKARQDF